LTHNSALRLARSSDDVLGVSSPNETHIQNEPPDDRALPTVQT
jgi:hypothetical protein